MTLYIYRIDNNETVASIDRPTEQQCADIARAAGYDTDQYCATPFFDDSWKQEEA